MPVRISRGGESGGLSPCACLIPLWMVSGWIGRFEGVVHAERKGRSNLEGIRLPVRGS